MGRRVQARRRDAESRALVRLTAAYLGVFALVIAALSAAAWWGIAANYRSIVGPALATPEGRAGLDAALRPALFAILSIDGALVLAVGAASYGLARLALRPLVLAREREERFSADVAHELRTPLGAIASIAQTARGGANPDSREAFESIARRALEGGELVADLLTLARASEADALDREPVDLAILARTVATELPARSTGSAARIELAAQSSIVLGDDRRLRQLARNLIENALAHAVAVVTVRVRCDGPSAIFEVDDDGPGVAAALAPHLFERFERGPESNGSGLGLAIARWVCEAHGGSIAYMGGARFVATLPRLP